MKKLTVYLKHNFDKYLLFIIIFAIAYNSFCVFFLKPNFITHDEGNYIYCSWRVSKGDVPYKDFFDHHISTSYFLLGAIFKFFGASINIARELMVIVCAITSLFMYLIAKKLTSKFLAVVVVLPYILLQPSFKASWFYLDSFVCLFATISAYLLIIILKNNNKNSNIHKFLFLSSLLTSFAVLFKQNAFFYWIFLVIFLIYYLKKEKKKLISKNFLYFILGLAIPLLIYLCYLILTKTLYLAFDYLFLFNFKNVNTSIGREFPYGFDLYLSILPCILALILSIYVFKNIDKKNKYVVIFLDLWIISTALLLYPLMHPFHVYPALAPSFILLALEYKIISNNRRAISKYSSKKLTVIFFIILLFAMPLMTILFNYVIYPDKDIPGSKEVVNFIKKNTEKEEKILVLPFNPEIYFQCKKTSPSKYQYLHRCFYKESIEKEIVENCEKEDVKFIVWGSGYNKTVVKGTGYKNLNFELNELKIIEKYILENYTLIKTYGNFQIYEKK